MKINILKLESSNWPAVENSILCKNLIPKSISVNQLNQVKKENLLIIPGVGNIHSLSNEIEKDFGIKNLKELISKNNIKVLGICLGFQFMCSNSQEDPESSCLNLFKYPVSSIYSPPKPSVGWRKIQRGASNLKDFTYEIENNFYYFTHSYYAEVSNSTYENQLIYYYKVSDSKKIIASILSKNFIGYQFHPEKSGEAGINLLYNSINYLLNNQ